MVDLGNNCIDVVSRNTGLVIHSIEPNSAMARDGRLHVGDRIIQVNGSSLNGLEFSRLMKTFISYAVVTSGGIGVE